MRENDIEKRLSFPRAKPKVLAVSFAYRTVAIATRLFGKKRILRYFLNGSWLFWRFAFELSGKIYGAKFHNQAKALNEKFLSRWIAKDDSVLDIGCGIGRWCEVASKYAESVVGIDYDETLIAEAKAETHNNNIEFFVGDVTKDLTGRKFNLALLIHVIEHIEKPDEFLRELKQVTERLLVEVPDFEHDPLNWVRLEQNCSFYSDGDHVREYTEDILVDQLTRNGWHVFETRKNGGAVLAVAEVKK
jgi:SAM-dependent methyltransferase